MNDIYNITISTYRCVYSLYRPHIFTIFNKVYLFDITNSRSNAEFGG